MPVLGSEGFCNHTLQAMSLLLLFVIIVWIVISAHCGCGYSLFRLATLTLTHSVESQGPGSMWRRPNDVFGLKRGER